MANRRTHQRDKDRSVIRRSGAPCGICGAPIDYTLPYLHPQSFVVDHVVPVHHGGQDSLVNKQAAHRACNRTKGARQDGGSIVRRSGSLARPQGEGPPTDRLPPFPA